MSKKCPKKFSFQNQKTINQSLINSVEKKIVKCNNIVHILMTTAEKKGWNFTVFNMRINKEQFESGFASNKMWSLWVVLSVIESM